MDVPDSRSLLHVCMYVCINKSMINICMEFYLCFVMFACIKYAFMYVRFHTYVWSCVEVGQGNLPKRSSAIQVGGQKTAAGLSGCLGRRLLAMPCALIHIHPSSKNNRKLSGLINIYTRR